MSYLLFATYAAAEARSRDAYAPLRSTDVPGDGAVTDALWSIIPHPTDGRAALIIPETPIEAGLGVSQEIYDALLSDAERAALLKELPSDWMQG